MMTQEIHVDTLIFELNKFLELGSISLSQMAGQLGVSKGHLSEIKNGKTLPALNLGLRILKICGLDTMTRRKWAHIYNMRVSEEYLEVHDKVENKESVINLNERISNLLANDLNLMNAYVDIVNREQLGISQEELMVEYGRDVVKKLKTLIKEDVIVQEDRMFKVGKCSPVITRNASYDLMKEIIDDQKEKFQHGELKGKFRFEINDLDESGYQELSVVFDEALKKAQEVIEKRKKAKGQPGNRYVFQLLLGQLKSIVLVFGLLLGGLSLFQSQDAFAQPMSNYTSTDTDSTSGGLSGGSSSRLTEEEIKMLEYIDQYFQHKRPAFDWSSIENETGFKFAWPQIDLSGVRLSVNRVCRAENNMIRSIVPERVCVKWKTVKRECFSSELGMSDCMIIDSNQPTFGNVVVERSCEEYAFQLLYKSNLITKEENLRDRFGNLKRNIILEQGATQFEVSILGNDDDNKYVKKAQKSYDLPECKMFEMII